MLTRDSTEPEPVLLTNPVAVPLARRRPGISLPAAMLRVGTVIPQSAVGGWSTDAETLRRLLSGLSDGVPPLPLTPFTHQES